MLAHHQVFQVNPALVVNLVIQAIPVNPVLADQAFLVIPVNQELLGIVVTLPLRHLVTAATLVIPVNLALMVNLAIVVNQVIQVIQVNPALADRVLQVIPVK